jgi:hypothetical protein
VTYGLVHGGLLGLGLSLLYSILLLALPVLLSLGDESDFQENFVGIYFFGFVLCAWGILPATIIGSLGGLFMVLMLALWRKKLPDIAAIAIGLCTGIVFVVLGNYLAWLSLSQSGLHDLSGDPISFMQFLVSPTHNSFYFLPSVVACPAFAYLGWRINGVDPTSYPGKGK